MREVTSSCEFFRKSYFFAFLKTNPTIAEKIASVLSIFRFSVSLKVNSMGALKEKREGEERQQNRTFLKKLQS